MATAGREAERSARRHAEQPPLGIEEVEERIEVVLVRSPAVQEDERPGRIARRLADPRLEWLNGGGHRLHSARGSGSGVSTFSTSVRRCSKAGGRMSDSPRCSGSSSIPKPGPSVASSKRTPLGSRK